MAVYNKPSVVSSPCDDGVFHCKPSDRVTPNSPPSWLKSYMVGDVRDEGEIFLRPLDPNKGYDWFRDSFAKFMEPADAEMVLRLYGLEPDADHAACRLFLRTLFGDCSFGIPQRNILQVSSLPETYGYHFDLVRQRLEFKF